MNISLEELAERFRREPSFVISTHINPEGDALGSQLALGMALEQLGKRVLLCNRDPVPSLFRFLPGWERIQVVEALDAASLQMPSDVWWVVVDCSGPERTGFPPPPPPQDRTLVIDHHITGGDPVVRQWTDPGAAATGEMIHRIIRLMGVSLIPAMATNLYAAVMTDTGSFRYSNTTPSSLQVAADLVAQGADPWGIAQAVYETSSLGRLLLLGKALNTLQRSPDGRVAWMAVTLDMFRETATSVEDLEGFVNHARAVEGVEVGMLLRELRDGQVKFSLRSLGRVNVAAVAQGFGGGGHHNAAGCLVRAPLGEARDRMLAALQAAMSPSMLPDPDKSAASGAGADS